jgi:hypothetical protein
VVSRAAWFLNLDAEEELGVPRGWRRRPALWRATEGHRARAAERLLAPGDVVLEVGQSLTGEWLGQAWCPTPDALRTLSSAGARPAPAPPIEVLRTVNDRRFLVAHGLAAPGTRVLAGESDWQALVEGPRKRPFGAAGRGQRVLATGSPSSQDEAWVRAGLARGGLVAEPELQDIRGEFVTHGLVSPSGEIWLGDTRRQEVDARGAWILTGGPEVTDVPLQAAAERAADALARAGYFGPFGVDAIVGVGDELHAVSDLNARFTMGWRDPRTGPGPASEDPLG